MKTRCLTLIAFASTLVAANAMFAQKTDSVHSIAPYTRVRITLRDGESKRVTGSILTADTSHIQLLRPNTTDTVSILTGDVVSIEKSWGRSRPAGRSMFLGSVVGLAVGLEIRRAKKIVWTGAGSPQNEYYDPDAVNLRAVGLVSASVATGVLAGLFISRAFLIDYWQPINSNIVRVGLSPSLAQPAVRMTFTF